MDIAAALESAKADGLPDSAGIFEMEIDWGYKEMKLSFAHRALQPEQKAVIEVIRVIDAVRVDQ